jgi:release factor glutamine methyltransferase
LTLFETLAAARHQLVAAGIPPDEAAIDVPLFACTILGWDRARLLIERSRSVPPGLEPRFSEWIARRIGHEPSAYIVGQREFWGLDFLVTPAVLIPRPESELIVEEALALVRELALDAPRIADIGTGSGNLAVSLAHELPSSIITATDVSPEALQVATRNAERHDTAARITIVETAYLDGIDEEFDIIVSNPPYVRIGDRPGLSRSVQREPAVALFGGLQGFDAVEGVLEASMRSLKPGGWLVMEFGFGQEAGVERLVSVRPALRIDHVRSDLQGIARTAIIQRGDQR